MRRAHEIVVLEKECGVEAMRPAWGEGHSAKNKKIGHLARIFPGPRVWRYIVSHRGLAGTTQGVDWLKSPWLAKVSDGQGVGVKVGVMVRSPNVGYLGQSPMESEKRGCPWIVVRACAMMHALPGCWVVCWSIRPLLPIDWCERLSSGLVLH